MSRRRMDYTSAGGLVVCYGRGCTVTMKRVAFDRCSLAVLAGAKVHLINCKFTMSDSSTEGIGIFAHGRGTEVKLNGGGIAYGAQGISVQHGAVASANGVTIKGVGVTAVEVMHERSRLTMLMCTVDGPTTSLAGKSGARGVFVHAKSTAALEEVNIKSISAVAPSTTGPRSGSARAPKLYSGVHVTMQSTAVLKNVNVTDTVGSCILFDEGCIGELEGCNIASSRAGNGLEVLTKGTEVEATGCR
jgi:hypothetical protein